MLRKLYNWMLGEEAQALLASWYVVPVSEVAPQDAIAIDISTLKTVDQLLRMGLLQTEQDSVKNGLMKSVQNK